MSFCGANLISRNFTKFPKIKFFFICVKVFLYFGIDCYTDTHIRTDPATGPICNDEMCILMLTCENVLGTMLKPRTARAKMLHIFFCAGALCVLMKNLRLNFRALKE
jgi:hypothetical protein